MSQERWNVVESFFDQQLLPVIPSLDSALAASAAAGLPAIQISPAQGAFLSLLAQALDARSILEVGTLGGYSAIWLAQSLPAAGRLLSLEIDPRHAAVAVANIAHAGLAASVEVRVGAALDTLRGLAEGVAPAPFDLIFIDADKPGNTGYFEQALRLSRPGTLIVVDNVVRDGAVADAASLDAAVVGVRRLVERVAAEPRVNATVIQTVGGKGYDGFLLARVSG